MGASADAALAKARAVVQGNFLAK